MGNLGNNNPGLANKAFSGILWAYAERITAQGISFLVTVILARLLAPNDFGILALIMAVISFFDTLLSSGFGIALVQKQDADSLDFSTILWAGVGFQTVVLIILWLLAPLFADFYHCPELAWLLRIVSFRLPLLAINSVQHAFVQKRMDFKKFFFSTSIGTMFSAVVGISLAYGGAGVWALVAQYMTNSLVDTIVLFFATRWYPTFRFSFDRLKPLLHFGGYIMIANVVIGFSNQVRDLIIGKKFSPADLAYYNRGSSFPNLFNANINGVLGSVLFPAFSNMNDNLPRMKAAMRRAVCISVYFMAPAMIGLSVIADSLVRVLLTEKWLGAVPFIWIFCLCGLMNTINSVSSQMIKALGKSKAYSVGGILQCSFQIVLLLIVAWNFDNVYYIALIAVISTFIGNIYAVFLNLRYVGYTLREQVSDLWESGKLSLIMAFGVYVIGWYDFKDIMLKLVMQCAAGAVIYLSLSLLARNPSIFYVMSLFKKRFVAKALI